MDMNRARSDGWRLAPDGNWHRTDVLMRRGRACAYEVRWRARSMKEGCPRRDGRTVGKLDVRQGARWEPVSVDVLDEEIRPANAQS